MAAARLLPDNPVAVRAISMATQRHFEAPEKNDSTG
jgi:hypothetical protein